MWVGYSTEGEKGAYKPRLISRYLASNSENFDINHNNHTVERQNVVLCLPDATSFKIS